MLKKMFGKVGDNKEEHDDMDDMFAVEEVVKQIPQKEDNISEQNIENEIKINQDQEVVPLVDSNFENVEEVKPSEEFQNQQEVKPSEELKTKTNPFAKHFQQKTVEENNEQPMKTSFFDKAKSLSENLVSKVEKKIEQFGEDKPINPENESEIIKKYEKLSLKLKQLENEIEEVRSENNVATKVDIILSENLKFEDLISKMEQSGGFMKQIAFYLKNEVNNVVQNYIEEKMENIIDRIKSIKLEELQLKNKANITLEELDSKIGIHKKQIVILENDIENKTSSIKELEKQILNEEETLKNISEENNRQNSALLELKRNVEEEKKRALANLELYKAEEKLKVDTEINLYKENAKEEIKENIDIQLEIQIEEKLKDFENLFKNLSGELKQQILSKLLNK